MIISRTPFRISFFGGGTDYPGWYRLNGGAVLATSIDKYCYISCRYLPPFFEHRFRVVYTKMENCQTIAEIAHPAVRGILQYMKLNRGLEIHHDADLPARSGMGSSSAFTVGLLNALRALQGKMSSKHELASQAIEIEQNLLMETVGAQDQVAAAYGGFNYVQFHKNDDVSVQPVTLRQERIRELNAQLMLFYSGIKRTASEIAGSYVPSIADRHLQLNALRKMVDDALDILAGSQGIEAFGALLHEGWMQKKAMGDLVSTPLIDGIYSRALTKGAIGGKLLGAGGGGFILLFAPPERQSAIRAELAELIHVPFQFTTNGSQIIFHDVESDYESEDLARVGA